MKRKKGFSLIELIVALIFFGIASASIALFYASNSKRIIDSEKSARLEVVAEKAYEEFKGILMQRMYTPELHFDKLVFDSIWQTYNEGDVVFTVTDTISGILFNSDIIIDSFEFDITKTGGVDNKNLAKTYHSGSRIWATIKSENVSEADSIRMQTVFSHHR